MKYNIIYVLFICLVLKSHEHCYANEHGTNNMSMRQDENNLQNLLDAAKSGDGEAQITLVYLYSGIGQVPGIQENNQQAEYWLQVALAQRQPEAFIYKALLNKNKPQCLQYLELARVEAELRIAKGIKKYEQVLIEIEKFKRQYIGYKQGNNVTKNDDIPAQPNRTAPKMPKMPAKNQ